MSIGQSCRREQFIIREADITEIVQALDKKILAIRHFRGCLDRFTNPIYLTTHPQVSNSDATQRNSISTLIIISSRPKTTELTTESDNMPTLPTRVLAGVTVPDTPLITDALSYAQAHLNPMAYNHVVRGWLFGVVIAQHTPGHHALDAELHSVAAILHDLGWDSTGELISADKRFEVDGANAARDFLRRKAPDWDARKVQLLWDAIALHSSQSIARYKEAEVALTCAGIAADFIGPEGVEGGRLGRGAYERILKEVPRLQMKEGVREIMCHLCITKPETTYDNFVGEFGEKYVEGYSWEGKRVIDLMEDRALANE